MSAADIAVQASSYTGNSNLGGSDFGFAKIDTKPISDLAQYTFLYNKSEYDQRQKDAEAAAKEIADYTSYDLTSGIKKDADLLQAKYDKLTNFIRDNPDALDYKNKEKWAEYKKLRNEMDNDVVGGKTRNVMYAARQKEIQDEPNVDLKKILQEELDKDVAESDIRTPLKHSGKYEQKSYDPSKIDVGQMTLQVVKKDANGIWTQTSSLLNMSLVDKQASVYTLGMDEQIDMSTPEGKRAALSRKNFWTQGADVYNKIVNDPAYRKTITNADGTTSSVLDETKMGSQASALVELAKDANKYIVETRERIKRGDFKDNMGNIVSFGGGLNERDYKEINFADGIDATELFKITAIAKDKGIQSDTKYQQTDDEIQRRAQDITAANNKMDNAVQWYNAKTSRITANKPTSGGIAVSTNGGVVPYWETYITPQIAKTGKMADPNFTGDIRANPKTLSGLDMALTNVKTRTEDANGNEKIVNKVIDENTKISIRVMKGVPIGVVIDGVFYDQNDINSKATQLQDKVMSGKQDVAPFGITSPKPNATTNTMSDADFQAYLKSKGLK